MQESSGSSQSSWRGHPPSCRCQWQSKQQASCWDEQEQRTGKVGDYSLLRLLVIQCRTCVQDQNLGMSQQRPSIVLGLLLSGASSHLQRGLEMVKGSDSGITLNLSPPRQLSLLHSYKFSHLFRLIPLTSHITSLLGYQVWVWTYNRVSTYSV